MDTIVPHWEGEEGTQGRREWREGGKEGRKEGGREGEKDGEGGGTREIGVEGVGRRERKTYYMYMYM